MRLEDFLKTVMRLVKHEAGELRLYPLDLLCTRLMSELRNLGDVELASETLSLITICLPEAQNEYNVSLQTYVNIIPERDPCPYAVKLLYP